MFFGKGRGANSFVVSGWGKLTPWEGLYPISSRFMYIYINNRQSHN